MDEVLIANELIDLRRQLRKVVFKIDLEEASDHVEWDLVDYILFRSSFGEKWSGWIGECISTTSFIVLANGSPFRLFQASTGF